MRIVATSDVHGAWEEIRFPSGDVLILAGDILPDASFSMNVNLNCEMQVPAQLQRLNSFVEKLHYKHVLMVGGNHDWCLDMRKQESLPLMTKIKYLEDSGAVIDGVHFYGSPWVPRLEGMAFYASNSLLKEKWAAIPKDTDILVTHCPPYGTLDWHPKHGYLGCAHLANRIDELPNLKAHFFGHIHHSYGKRERAGKHYFNCAMMSESYSPTNPPHVFTLNL